MSVLLLKSPKVKDAGIESDRTTLTQPPQVRHSKRKGILRIGFGGQHMSHAEDVLEVARIQHPPLVLVSTEYNVFLLTAEEFDAQVPAKHRASVGGPSHEH